MLGKVEVGLMVCGPAPGMLKPIVSVPACALAAAIASRKVHSASSQTPVPGSAVELTIKVMLACGDIANDLVQPASAKARDARWLKCRLNAALLTKHLSATGLLL